MANEPRGRQSRAAATPQNSATMGVILVVAAAVIAVLLFNAGGGTAKETDTDKTAAESANGGDTTTTSTIVVAATTPPAALEVVVGNGSGITGRAKATAEKLNGIGYTNTKYVDGNPSPSTIVYFSPGHDADAVALALSMSLGEDRAQPLPAESPLKAPEPTAALTVLVGADFDPAVAVFGTTVPPSN
jgi:hypothetical protein